MKIAILGAGAMGSLYGGYLSKNNEVWMVDIWEAHVNAIKEKGLDIDELDGSVTHVTPHATTDPAEVGIVDLAVVFVKSTQTTAAMEKIRPLSARTPPCSLCKTAMATARISCSLSPVSRSLSARPAMAAP